MAAVHQPSTHLPLLARGLLYSSPAAIKPHSKNISVLDPSSSEETLVDGSRVERVLGDTEVSYYLPSRESGVNDMYLHLGFNSPSHLMKQSRVRLVWAILRIRHLLLASRIEMRSYQDVKFVCVTPSSCEAALTDGDNNLEYRTQSKDELLDSYLNGPRTLSDDRLSYLIISQEDPVQESGSNAQDFHFLLCATHFLGDGMALHQCANDFFGLLGGTMTEEDLLSLLESEWALRYSKEAAATLPSSMEDRLPNTPEGKLRRAAALVDFQVNQRKQIGGQAFLRESKLPRRTVVPTISFDSARTKKMLASCKAQRVSISSALFAICNIAWAKLQNHSWEHPVMMYSALNMRPYLTANQSLNDSYWFLAIGYFNVILPSFIPSDPAELGKIFWHRARLAKAQSIKAAKSPMVIPRSRQMARERGERARMWAKEDDDKARGIVSAPKPKPAPSQPKGPPSTALVGLSLLGNLDGIYKHQAFPDIQMHTLTTGSRQRSGGMLLFGYTFAGKLWVSLGYDENGFHKETVDAFWKNILTSLDELLVV